MRRMVRVTTQNIGKVFQYAITGAMTIGIIDLSKIINID